MSPANRNDAPQARQPEPEPEREPVGEPVGEPGPGAVGPPFGPAFFASALHARVRAQCDEHPEGVPVVELHLADGTTLDVCHIPVLEAPWLAAQVYRDRETCEDMDLVFVPYGLIMRVTIAVWHRSQRPIGFNLDEHAPALPSASG